MKIRILPKAIRKLKKLPKTDQVILANKIRNLPNATNVKKLQGYKDIFRVRVSDYRIVYKLREDEIIVIAIGHRGEIYKIIKKLLK